MDTREEEVVDLQSGVTWTETLHSVSFWTFKSDLYKTKYAFWSVLDKKKKREIFSLLLGLYLVVEEYCF